ncbi:ketopantoate reductase family protein [Rhodococcus sp. 077-4]|uniref:ketopantoate reductase family protein n=1 Tax=Rhodococcus sp. 077-4 TaxID=2789271 RepID=UPI0039F5606D
MNILVVGTGAVGGFLGTQLHLAGREVTFLARPDSAATLRDNGLRLIDHAGTEHVVAPAVTTARGIDRQWDIIVLAVKGQALQSVIADLAPAVGPATVIVPTLNGMTHMRTLAEWFGADHLLGGVCFLATEQRMDRTIVQLTPAASLTVGELDQRVDRIDSIANSLDHAGYTLSVSETISHDMWEKWFLLATAGALNCLLDADAGSAVAVPAGFATARGLIDEAKRVCAAAGFEPRSAALARAFDLLTTRESRFTTSMYRDFRAGRAVEHETIVGDLIDEGHRHGIDVPLFEAAYARLCTYSHALAGK